MSVFAQSLAAAAPAGAAPATPAAGGTQATIKLAGLKAGTKIEVVGENRSLTAEDGQFTDPFAPLAEHVYKMGS